MSEPIQYVPRILRNDGMVPFDDVKHYTHIEFVRYVKLEDYKAIQRERDALKAIVYNAKVLAKEVAEWGMQTEVEEIDLTTAEFGETWWLANKIVAQIEKEEAP
jgi:hypothetical protein